MDSYASTSGSGPGRKSDVGEALRVLVQDVFLSTASVVQIGSTSVEQDYYTVFFVSFHESRNDIRKSHLRAPVLIHGFNCVACARRTSGRQQGDMVLENPVASPPHQHFGSCFDDARAAVPGPCRGPSDLLVFGTDGTSFRCFRE